MSNSISDNVKVMPLDEEVRRHLPKSFQLMIKVEEKAKVKFNQIMKDIQEGKTTMDEVKRNWNL